VNFLHAVRIGRAKRGKERGGKGCGTRLAKARATTILQENKTRRGQESWATLKCRGCSLSSSQERSRTKGDQGYVGGKGGGAIILIGEKNMRITPRPRRDAKRCGVGKSSRLTRSLKKIPRRDD